MDITFYGAAGEVTGSCHLVSAAGKRVLLDCGMVQGDRDADARNAAEFPFDPKSIDALVLSHAHLDHCGRIPLLVKRGFSGPIYTTSATADLANIIMSDSAHIADMDARDANRSLAPAQQPTQPLYTQADVDAAMKLIKPVNYDEPREILPGTSVTLRDAGHILGSATVEVAVTENGTTRTLVFSGDLGPGNLPLLCDPEKVDAADAVILESTYGNRLHKTREDTLAELAAIFQAAHKDGGNVVIPAFAVGRTQ
ncbi:MAG TPA: MBL fold metallo-hydrolase, partial [Rhodanobacteraceae bacterium]|nr:MBL fold metallo-hydrolase [Rhodanobacteraceae bacterium]